MAAGAIWPSQASKTGVICTSKTGVFGRYGIVNKLIIVPYGSNISQTSSDGITWTGQTIPSHNWKGVCYSPDLRLYCAVSYDNYIATSPDGITWTARTPPASKSWNSVCWSPTAQPSGQTYPGLFCAVGGNGSNMVMTSPDGITWTNRTSASSSGNIGWMSVCWAPGISKFCALAFGGGTSPIMTSPDGVTWTAQTTSFYFSNPNNGCICWSPTKGFCVVGSNPLGGSQGVMTSPDGITWTGQSTPVGCQSIWDSVCWSDSLNLFCAVDIYGITIMTSPDGATWTQRTSPHTYSVYSTCGICWSDSLSLFCAVGDSWIMTSSDGVTWTLRTASSAKSWSSVCCSG
jgi:hypothetical protein